MKMKYYLGKLFGIELGMNDLEFNEWVKGIEENVRLNRIIKKQEEELYLLDREILKLYKKKVGVGQ